ncbi:MAG: membrane protein insertase YidC, partial [bacterium]|nr:membrane protein insertase YidC [bacterium]
MSTDFLGPSSGGQGPDMKRLLLAVLLMTGILMVYSSYFGPKVSDEKLGQAAEAAESKNLDVESSPPLNKDLVGYAEKASDIVATAANIPLKIEKFSIGMKGGVDPGSESSIAARGGYFAAVSNQGAQIVDFQLVGYETPIELGATHAGVNLFAVASRDASVTLPVNSRYEVLSSSDDKISLQHMTEQGVRVLRHFKFNPDQFMIEQEVILKNESKLSRRVALDILMNAEEPIENKSSGIFSKSVEPTSIVWNGLKEGAVERETVSMDAIEKTKEFIGAANYVGFDKRYFLVALIPAEANLVEKTSVATWSELVDGVEKKGAVLTLHEKAVVLKPGELTTFSYSSYLGPKQLSLLREAGHGLDENINFGWFGVISRPLLWLLGQIYGFVGNFGVAIILLTLLIKLVTFPLTQKSFVSMQQMKKINPEIKELQKKYSHDRTLLSQKQMELYKEKGVNPAAGCLPMLIQMPVW